MARAIIVRRDPCYWGIALYEHDKLYAVRVTWNKCVTIEQAAEQCFGRPPEPEMTFYNLGSERADISKLPRP